MIWKPGSETIPWYNVLLCKLHLRFNVLFPWQSCLSFNIQVEHIGLPSSTYHMMQTEVMKSWKASCLFSCPCTMPPSPAHPVIPRIGLLFTRSWSRTGSRTLVATPYSVKKSWNNLRLLADISPGMQLLAKVYIATEQRFGWKELDNWNSVGCYCNEGSWISSCLLLESREFLTQLEWRSVWMTVWCSFSFCSTCHVSPS